MTCLPPEPAAVLAALQRLPATSHPAAAALHLATPVGVAVGVEARTAGPWFTVRTHSVAALEHGVHEAARAATAAAAAAHVDGDEYLDLTGDPAGWVKLLRSGTRRVLFGADVLFGAPLTTVEDGVEDADVAAWADLWSRGGGCGLPAVLPSGAVADGSPARVVLRPPVPNTAEPSLAPAGRRALDRLARRALVQVASELGAVAGSCTPAGSRFPGTADYTATVVFPGWEAQFPLTVTAATHMAGVAWRDLAPAARVLRGLPPELTVVGELPNAEAVVARHGGTGLRMLVRRTGDRS